MEDEEFGSKMQEDLDKMNEAQRCLRLAMLLILSDRDYEKFQKLDKKYDIERTKELF